MNCREKTQNRISLVLKLLTLTLQLGQLGKLTLTQAADLEVNFLSTYLLLVTDDPTILIFENHRAPVDKNMRHLKNGKLSTT